METKKIFVVECLDYAGSFCFTDSAWEDQRLADERKVALEKELPLVAKDAIVKVSPTILFMGVWDSL